MGLSDSITEMSHGVIESAIQDFIAVAITQVSDEHKEKAKEMLSKKLEFIEKMPNDMALVVFKSAYEDEKDGDTVFLYMVKKANLDMFDVGQPIDLGKLVDTVLSEL